MYYVAIDVVCGSLCVCLLDFKRKYTAAFDELSVCFKDNNMQISFLREGSIFTVIAQEDAGNIYRGEVRISIR